MRRITCFTVAILLVCGPTLAQEDNWEVPKPAILETLRDVRTDLDYSDTDLYTVLDSISDLSQTNLNFVVDSQVVAAPGTTEGDKVDPVVYRLRLRDVSLSTAIDAVLAPKGLTYVIQDEVLWISTEERFIAGFPDSPGRGIGVTLDIEVISVKVPASAGEFYPWTKEEQAKAGIRPLSSNNRTIFIAEDPQAFAKYLKSASKGKYSSLFKIQIPASSGKMTSASSSTSAVSDETPLSGPSQTDRFVTISCTPSVLPTGDIRLTGEVVVTNQEGESGGSIEFSSSWRAPDGAVSVLNCYKKSAAPSSKLKGENLIVTFRASTVTD